MDKEMEVGYGPAFQAIQHLVAVRKHRESLGELVFVPKVLAVLVYVLYAKSPEKAPPIIAIPREQQKRVMPWRR